MKKFLCFICGFATATILAILSGKLEDKSCNPVVMEKDGDIFVVDQEE